MAKHTITKNQLAGTYRIPLASAASSKEKKRLICEVDVVQNVADFIVVNHEGKEFHYWTIEDAIKAYNEI